jgi:hypothetical protein
VRASSYIIDIGERQTDASNLLTTPVAHLPPQLRKSQVTIIETPPLSR